MSMDTRLPDFSVMMNLHQQDPEAFEAFRRHLLQEAVEKAPPAHRESLKKSVDRMDAVRSVAATPLEAAVAASRMMQEAMDELLNAWTRTRFAVAGLQTTLVLERFRR
jgi:hypothetical protein